jgi:hypothetical protein
MDGNIHQGRARLKPETVIKRATKKSERLRDCAPGYLEPEYFRQQVGEDVLISLVAEQPFEYDARAGWEEFRQAVLFFSHFLAPFLQFHLRINYIYPLYNTEL